MRIIFVALITSFATDVAYCTIDGLNYKNPLNFHSLQQRREDPCNALYWYPRHLPDYCYHSDSSTERPKPTPSLIPFPIPIPLPPQPIPVPMLPIPALPSIPQPVGPLPYGIPLEPTNPMLPVGGVSSPLSHISQSFMYQPRREQFGFLPGVPGLIAEDGGINILPFSDAYSDLLEKRKQKIIRKRLQMLLDKYDNWPRNRRARRRRKYKTIYQDY